MDDLRKVALHEAVLALNGAAYTEVVKAAEAFYVFLAKGEVTVGLDLSKTWLQNLPPPVPQQDYGHADQTPKGYAFGAGHASDCARHNMPAYSTGPCDCGIADADDIENIKTRLVRPV